MVRTVRFTGTLALCCCGLFAALRASQPTNLTAFKPGGTWLADNGVHIDCHAGNIIYNASSRTFFWFGEHRGQPRGVSCYSSQDLYNWKNEGVVFLTASTYSIAVLERPKVSYNASTRKYVMWFHYDNSGYSLAHMGVASSDSVKGPYALISHFQPNGHDSRDMGMFIDDDGKEYLIYSTGSNTTMRMVLLTSDYLNVSTIDVDLKTHCEGPGLLKYNGQYYLMTSLCSGWTPNQATYYTASSVMGPYTAKGDPCIGDSNHTTFNSQPCYIFKAPGYANGFMYMGDRWNGSGSQNSQYVFLPITITSSAVMQLKWAASWTLSVFTPSSLRPPDSYLKIAEVYFCKAPVQGTVRFDVAGRKTRPAVIVHSGQSPIVSPAPGKHDGVLTISNPGYGRGRGASAGR